jgi:hypothetical protein
MLKRVCVFVCVKAVCTTQEHGVVICEERCNRFDKRDVKGTE